MHWHRVAHRREAARWWLHYMHCHRVAAWSSPGVGLVNEYLWHTAEKRRIGGLGGGADTSAVRVPVLWRGGT